ncbi:PIN domain-containing protein [Nonomuraea typhae]|uniref:PIN domain-containing protein n=1 Tax=Nonomuraea typhae TaxID=2603600 RepID=A0ABW7YYE9_9ACTN
MSGKTFLDTNVFVYADDADNPRKQEIAQRLIAKHAASGTAMLSTQVLMEYVAVARKKLGFSLPECRRSVLVMSHLEVRVITPELVQEALDLASTRSLSHWDALIVRTASAAGCATLISEDLQHGQRLDGLTIENPFKAG